MLPGAEPWKELLLLRLQRCTPVTGGPWQLDIRWIFTEMRRVGPSRRVEERFACCILRTWEMLRPALSQTPPTDQDTCLRQLLVWNPLIRTARGHMLGSRPHVSWGAMAVGPARSLDDWLQFMRLSEERQRECLAGMRGSELMISDILEAIPEHWMQQQSAEAPHWMGAFTRTEIFIAVRGCTSTTSLFFEVGNVGRLQRVTSEDSIVSSCIFQRIRVIGIRD